MARLRDWTVHLGFARSKEMSSKVNDIAIMRQKINIYVRFNLNVS